MSTELNNSDLQVIVPGQPLKPRYCSRCQMLVRHEWHPVNQRFEVVHIAGEERIWRCPKAPVFIDEVTHSKRSKYMTDAAGNTIRKSEYSLSGFPATALFRWMGANGFNYTQVAAYVDVAGIKIPPQTIKRHIIDGAHGDGKKAKSGRTIPVLNDDQRRDLMAYKATPEPPAAKETKSTVKPESKKKAAKKASGSTKNAAGTKDKGKTAKPAKKAAAAKVAKKK